MFYCFVLFCFVFTRDIFHSNRDHYIHSNVYKGNFILILVVEEITLNEIFLTGLKLHEKISECSARQGLGTTFCQWTAQLTKDNNIEEL